VAAPAGWAATDDEIFWCVATVEVPELIERVVTDTCQLSPKERRPGM